MDLKETDVNALAPNGYNFNEMTKGALQTLSSEIRKRGYVMHHITARQAADSLVIIDGEHQWRAAMMAGLKTVPVQVVEATEAEAIAETYRRNGLRGDANRVRLSRAIKTLQAAQVDDDGSPLSNVKTGKMLGRSDVWVKTTLQYGELADLAAQREGFPDEKAIAKITEKEVKAWLAFAHGEGPNPMGGDDEEEEFALNGEGAAEDGPKAEGTPEEKAEKVLAGVLKKLAKMSQADRAQVAAAIKRFDKADAKAAADKVKGEPELPLHNGKGGA